MTLFLSIPRSDLTKYVQFNLFEISHISPNSITPNLQHVDFMPNMEPVIQMKRLLPPKNCMKVEPGQTLPTKCCNESFHSLVTLKPIPPIYSRLMLR